MREVGHSPKIFGHGRRGSSQDFPQLRAFLGRNVSPLGERCSDTHLESNYPSKRSTWPSWGALTDWDSVCSFACQKPYQKATSCPQSTFLEKARKALSPSSSQRQLQRPGQPCMQQSRLLGARSWVQAVPPPRDLVHPPRGSPPPRRCSPGHGAGSQCGRPLRLQPRGGECHFRIQIPAFKWISNAI